MLEYLIPLLGSYVGSGLMGFAIYPLFALGILSAVPDIIRRFIEWR